MLAADADPVSAEWFPHIRRGMLRGLEAARELGREWVGARVEVRKVHTHPTDTTAHGCERYGFSFALDELPRRGVQRASEGVPNQPPAPGRAGGK